MANNKKTSTPTINLNEISEWETPPIVSFDSMASLVIAKWVLWIFAGVYLLSFFVGFLVLWKKESTFDQGIELIKYMIGSVLPLVTLAVGYYLGDKTAASQSSDDDS